MIKSWPNFLSLFTILLATTLHSQNIRLKIVGENPSQSRTIDSLGYTAVHPDSVAVKKETLLFSDKLSKIGYLQNSILDLQKVNDSLYNYKSLLGNQIKNAHIYIGEEFVRFKPNIGTFEADTATMKFSDVERFLNTMLGNMEKRGFALAKVKLDNITFDGNTMKALLYSETTTERVVNRIVFEGYPKFPEGFKKQIIKSYRKKSFNKSTIEKLYNDISKLRFVDQTKYPEILFTTDSTALYVYINKAKGNSFDGFIGFGNSDGGKIKITGYLDLILQNTLNTGEIFNLNWKSDGNDQKTFNATLELPYIFRTPFGISGQLNIFKQDSTFQNTKTAIDLAYYFNFATKVYLGYQSTESSDIQNTNSSSISDYNSSFITSRFEYKDINVDDFLFPEKTRVSAKAGFGSRSTTFEKNDQYFIELNLKHNFYLNRQNSISIRSQNYFLQSPKYIVNELYRFGGVNSLRGFAENSLQANQLTSLLSEYRFLLTPSIYVHTITDYAYFEDDSTNNGGGLLGLGLGFGLLTKNGLLNLIYANGSAKGDQIKLSNSIVHVTFRATF